MTSMTSPLRPATAPGRQARRPRSVVVAVALQLLIAVAFLSIPAVGFAYRAEVQAAVEAEVQRQGAPATVLADNNISLVESGGAIVVPVAIALGITILALLNLAGNRAGRILSWIAQPLVFAGNLAIMASQGSAVQYLESAFEASGDATLQRLNAGALLNAAGSVYPDWVSSLTITRNALVLVGSLLVIVLLAVPSAKAYFRRSTSS